MGLGNVRTVIVAREERDPGDAASCSPASPLVDLEGLARLPLHQRPRRNIFRKSFDDAQLRFLFEDAARRPDPARPLEARHRSSSTTRSAKRSGRSTSSAIIRPTATRQMGELIANFRARASRRRISSNTWMDEATRKEALAKLASFDPRIGHPAKYIDYSDDEGGPRRPARQCRARRGIRLEPATVAAAQAGRSQPVGHDPADQ